MTDLLHEERQLKAPRIGEDLPKGPSRPGRRSRATKNSSRLPRVRGPGPISPDLRSLYPDRLLSWTQDYGEMIDCPAEMAVMIVCPVHHGETLALKAASNRPKNRNLSRPDATRAESANAE